MHSNDFYFFFNLEYLNTSFYTKQRRSSGIRAHVYHRAMADPRKKAALAACPASLLAPARRAQESSSGADALKGKHAPFLLNIVSLCTAELRVRAGSRATDAYGKKHTYVKLLHPGALLS